MMPRSLRAGNRTLPLWAAPTASYQTSISGVSGFRNGLALSRRYASRGSAGSTWTKQ